MSDYILDGIINETIYENHYEKLEIEIKKFPMIVNENNFNYNVEMCSDLIRFRYIIFELNEETLNITNDEFLFHIKFSTLDFNIDSVVQKNYLSLYANLKPIIKLRNGYAITIPFDYTYGELILISLCDSMINISIENINVNLFKNVTLTGELIFLDSAHRIALISNNHQKIIQIFESITFNCIEGLNEIILPFELISKGYFIECDNNSLEKIGLKFNGHDRFDEYDRSMIDLYGHKISNNLTYISYGGGNNYSDTSLTSYRSALNQDNIRSIKLYITMNKVEEIKIHSIELNILEYINKKCKFKYGKNCFTNKLNAWPIENKFIGTIYCPILCNNIDKNYGLCIMCNNIFDYKLIKQWLLIANNCPICRKIWTNKKMYVNI